MSAEGRANIAAAVRKRWAQKRAAEAETTSKKKRSAKKAVKKAVKEAAAKKVPEASENSPEE